MMSGIELAELREIRCMFAELDRLFGRMMGVFVPVVILKRVDSGV